MSRMGGLELLDNKEVGRRIKDLRLKRKMTREELAEKAEMSTSFLYEIETGKKSFSAYTLSNLAKALNVEADFILCRCQKKREVLTCNDDLSRDTLLLVQQILMEVCEEIQDLIDE